MIPSILGPYEVDILGWMHTDDNYKIFTHHKNEHNPYITKLRRYLLSRDIHVTDKQIYEYMKNKTQRVRTLGSKYLATTRGGVDREQTIPKVLESKMKYFCDYYELFHMNTARIPPTRNVGLPEGSSQSSSKAPENVASSIGNDEFKSTIIEGASPSEIRPPATKSTLDLQNDTGTAPLTETRSAARFRRKNRSSIATSAPPATTSDSEGTNSSRSFPNRGHRCATNFDMDKIEDRIKTHREEVQGTSRKYEVFNRLVVLNSDMSHDKLDVLHEVLSSVRSVDCTSERAAANHFGYRLIQSIRSNDQYEISDFQDIFHLLVESPYWN